MIETTTTEQHDIFSVNMHKEEGSSPLLAKINIKIEEIDDLLISVKLLNREIDKYSW